MDAISNILSHFNPKPESLQGICPECGSNILRKINRQSFTLYADLSELDYGIWECAEHHTFEVVPEYCRDNNPDYPVGIKIK